MECDGYMISGDECGPFFLAFVLRFIYMVWIICDGYMISGDECGPFFQAFVFRLRENPGENLNQEPGPTGDRTGLAV